MNTSTVRHPQVPVPVRVLPVPPAGGVADVPAVCVREPEPLREDDVACGVRTHLHAVRMPQLTLHHVLDNSIERGEISHDFGSGNN